MYGHVEEPAPDWVRHMLLLAPIQERLVDLRSSPRWVHLRRGSTGMVGRVRIEARALAVHALADCCALGDQEFAGILGTLGFETSLACLQRVHTISRHAHGKSYFQGRGATFGEYVPPEEISRQIRTIGRSPGNDARPTKFGAYLTRRKKIRAAVPAQLPMRGLKAT